MLLCGNSQCSRQIRNKKTAKRGKDAIQDEPESNGGSKPSDSKGWRLITRSEESLG